MLVCVYAFLFVCRELRTLHPNNPYLASQKKLEALFSKSSKIYALKNVKNTKSPENTNKSS